MIDSDLRPSGSELDVPASGLRGLTGVLLGTAVAVFLFWSGRVTAALVLAAVLALLLAVPRARRAATRYAAKFGRAVSTAIFWVLLALLYFLVFTPVAFLARLTGSTAIERRQAHETGTAWVAKVPSPQRDWRRQYAAGSTATEGVRRSLPARSFRAVAITTGLLLLFGLLDVGVGNALRALRGSSDPRASSVAMRDLPWAQEYFAEESRLRREFVPFLGWKRGDIDGRYITVKDGIRETYSAGTSGNAVEVDFYGGSTMWGSGQRDDTTIPSVVVKLAQKDGIAIRARNLGEVGYVLWQELHRFQSRASKGDTPHIAVFYDGVNEPWPQLWIPTDEPTHQSVPEMARRLNGDNGFWATVTGAWNYYKRQSFLASVARRFRGVSRPVTGEEPTRGSAKDLAERTVHLHRRAVDLAERTADSYGVTPYFFWQPSAYTKKLHPKERPALDYHGAVAPTLLSAHRRMRTMLRPPVIDLTGALDSVEGPVMADAVHTNERGAAAIAAALYSHLKPRLIELTRNATR